MAYTPYYPGGWQSGEEGGTPITPAALNNIENGIEALADITTGLSADVSSTQLADCNEPISRTSNKVYIDSYQYTASNIPVSGTTGLLITYVRSASTTWVQLALSANARAFVRSQQNGGSISAWREL